MTTKAAPWDQKDVRQALFEALKIKNAFLGPDKHRRSR